jgi:hypothetical protein
LAGASKSWPLAGTAKAWRFDARVSRPRCLILIDAGFHLDLSLGFAAAAADPKNFLT